MISREISVPVWTLTTRDMAVPEISDGGSMTPDRLAELRTVLAAMADAPIATLEAHPVPEDLDRSRGMHLGSASPLAVHLSQLIGQATKTGAARAAAAGAGGEALYRMVVPAKFAAQVGGGLLTPMASKAVSGGVLSPLMGPSGIVGQAAFVPAGGKVAAGAGALTVAAPLMMMAVAAGVSWHADRQRQQALENITALLEKLHSDALERECSDLDSCRDAIEMATAIVLDEGRIGQAVAVGHAVDKVNTAIAKMKPRLTKWQRGLEELGGKPVEIAVLRKKFVGIDREGGEFRTHLELAELAIALKKRVIVLQAVDQAQLNPGNPFENFVRTLKDHQEQVIKLESEIAGVKRSLGRLRLDRSHGVRDGIGITAGDVDHLLRTAYRLHDEFGAGVDPSIQQSDLAIEIARNSDGSVVVFPALAA